MGEALKIGITGLPGAGKTQALSKVIEMLEADGKKVGGMITEPMVKQALDADKPLLLTLHKKSRNPLLQDIRRRDDIRILEVTQVNRNLLPYKIVKLLKGEML